MPNYELSKLCLDLLSACMARINDMNKLFVASSVLSSLQTVMNRLARRYVSDQSITQEARLSYTHGLGQFQSLKALKDRGVGKQSKLSFVMGELLNIYLICCFERLKILYSELMAGKKQTFVRSSVKRVLKKR